MLAVAPACDRSSAWPPNQTRLVEIFDRHKSTFVAIEAEMITDGLTRMGPVIFSQMQSTSTVPTLSSERAVKYAALFEGTQMYLDVTRLDESTAFELLLHNVGPRLYLPQFLHTSRNDALPRCEPAMQQDSCGSCSVPLAPDWLLVYSWFPASPEAEARQC